MFDTSVVAAKVIGGDNVIVAVDAIMVVDLISVVIDVVKTFFSENKHWKLFFREKLKFMFI
jgi:hypothetical protein